MPVRTKDPLDAASPARVTPAGAPGARSALGALAITAAFVLAACGGSSSKSASTAPPATALTTAATTSPAAGGSSEPVLTGDAATIKGVYERFLDLSVPVAQKTNLIQDGTEFESAMAAEAQNPQAKNIGLKVSDVKVTGAHLATVTFTILVSGQPLLPNQHGYAVKDNGTWKVAGVTFCGLLAAQGAASVPPVCSKPAATSLPTQ